MVGPVEVPGGDRIAVLRDPQGAVFAVHSKTEKRE
jgi:predicted enzyme related to lactoylglutathione lyase